MVGIASRVNSTSEKKTAGKKCAMLSHGNNLRWNVWRSDDQSKPFSLFNHCVYLIRFFEIRMNFGNEWFAVAAAGMVASTRETWFLHFVISIKWNGATCFDVCQSVAKNKAKEIRFFPLSVVWKEADSREPIGTSTCDNFKCEWM